MNRKDEKAMFGNNPFKKAQARQASAFDPGTQRNPIHDTVGIPIEVGHLIHLPKDAIAQPMIMGEVVRVIEPSVLETGQPKAPPLVIVQFVLPIPIGRDGTAAFCYVVGKKQVEGQAQIQADLAAQAEVTDAAVGDVVDAANGLLKEVPHDVKLDAEKEPE